jgi:methylmalonyl-CoA mutase
MMTRRDPFVNTLRATAAVVAAGLGGADGITVLPHTAAIGLPDGFARRIARNTQLILLEESNLAKVVDPAAGAGGLESLTHELCVTAWMLFQEIEKAGGVAAALEQGLIQAKVAAVCAEREKAVAVRRDALTGTSEFPDIAEAPAAVLAPSPFAPSPSPPSWAEGRGEESVRQGQTLDAWIPLQAQTRGAPPASHPSPPVEVASTRLRHYKTDRNRQQPISIGGEGAGSGQSQEPCPQIAPLLCRRLAEPFEALRDASDRMLKKTGARPKIFLANLGRLADFTARATFAKNFFEAGGIVAVTSDGFGSRDEMLAAFKASGAALACLCGSDETYAAEAIGAAQAVSAAGATHVYLVGRPGEREAALKGAGVGTFIYTGCCDVVATLTAAHGLLGIN